MDHRSHATRSRLVAGALALSLLAAACSGSGSDASPTARPKASTTTKPTPTTTDGGDDSPIEPLGEMPEGESLPPVHLFTEAPPDAVPPSLRQGIRAHPAVPAKGPTKLTGSTKPGWHTIDRSPSKSSGGKGSSSSFPGGTRREFDADDGSMTQWNPDGSVDLETIDGGRAHVGDDGMYYQDPDGTRKYYGEGGGEGEKGGDGEDGNGTEPPPAPYTNPPTPPGKKPSGGIGEPHYLTEDGEDVTSQVLGEFILSTGFRGQEVQARTQPWKKSPSAAAITALAFGIDDQRIQVDVDGTVLVDGKAAPDGEAQEFGFEQGGAAGVWRASADGPATTVIVVWPDLSQARITFHDGWLSFDLQWREATGDRAGILGSDDGDATNDLTSRDGQVVAAEQVDELVRSWQLTDDETLFTYQDGLGTTDYIVDDFPTEDPAPDLEAGAEACQDVPDGFARDACAYDVGLTGDDGWVEPAGAFGARLAADASLRAIVATLQELLGTSTDAPAPDDDPRVGDGITLSVDDRSGATDTGPTETVRADLEVGSSMTYRFNVDVASEVKALSNDLSCPNDPYVQGRAGYAFFADDGTVVSGPRLACDDDPDATPIDPGTYYVKLVGPGSVDIHLSVDPA